MNRIIHLLLFIGIVSSLNSQEVFDSYGALIRSDTLTKNIYICFTGHEHFEGFDYVLRELNHQNIKASFFLTGDFVRAHSDLVRRIANAGHFVGAHSDKHLLYNDWVKRDSLLCALRVIEEDILNNLKELENVGIYPKYFMPPYEWYNQEVVEIAESLQQITVNFSPGTRSNADYTTPDMPNYIASEDILNSIFDYERVKGMNGFHLLIHPGTDPQRSDKLYLHLDKIIAGLKSKGYQFQRLE